MSKYSRKNLEKAVRTSKTLQEVLIKIGASRTSGGVYSYIKRKIEEYNLDKSHFDPIGRAGGKATAAIRKIKWQNILIKRPIGRRERCARLRRAMIESGLQYACSSCNINTWKEKPLRLEIDHINGNPLDNRKKNLRFLCPNCHSQTETYCKSSI